MSNPVTSLLGAAVAMGLLELFISASMEVPAVALVFAVLFLVGAYAYHRRRSNVVAALLGAMFLIELVGLPFYERGSWVDWSVQGLVGLLSILGLTGAIAVLASRRVRRQPARA